MKINGKTVEELKKIYPTINTEKHRYILIEDAYLDNDHYSASAIRDGDRPDEYGGMSTYMVSWEFAEDFDPLTDDEEGDACDWENPDSIREIGRIYPTDLRYTPAEFAKIAGVTVNTLQRWDRDGVLKANRTITNRRYYTDEHVMKLK